MIPPGWRCAKRIGFLFPHPCERATPEGCPHCDGGRIADPYRSRTDRYGYSDFDSDDDWDSSGGLTAGSAMNFTEADGSALVGPDESFEDDFSAS